MTSFSSLPSLSELTVFPGRAARPALSVANVDNVLGSCLVRDFAFQTDAVYDPNGANSSEPAIRVVLPKNYYNSSQQYPVIYLLHGGNESVSNYGGPDAVDASYTAWTGTCNTAGQAITLLNPTASSNREVILVSLEGGRFGFYNDWARGNIISTNDNGTPNNTADDTHVFGQLRYEQFHVDQVIPWVEANFRAAPYREKRALVGLSMGGYGAIKYAAKNPDKFVSVASFSGALNNQDHDAAFNFPWSQGIGQADLLKAMSVLVTGYDDSMYGTANDAAVAWSANNPVKLAENLRGMHVYLTAGAGCYVPFDYGCDLGASAIETEGVTPVTRDFRTALEYARNPVGTGTLAIPYGYRSVPKGVHAWNNWRNAFPVYLDMVYPMLTGSVDTSYPQYKKPTVWSHVSGKAAIRVYDWVVRFQNGAGSAQADNERLNRLAVNGVSSFSVEGTGYAQVLTGKVLAANARYRVQFSNPTLTIAERYVYANAQGQLALAPFLVANSGVAKTTITLTKQ